MAAQVVVHARRPDGTARTAEAGQGHPGHVPRKDQAPDEVGAERRDGGAGGRGRDDGPDLAGHDSRRPTSPATADQIRL
ncbi:hypothetical protein ACQEVS_08705 [Streptomyces sp. CA-181903]|uniref:hypothetical protein n=1 Tax=Streptomyces sp. CA-181903 TaxID=3240055 RepID=UPI003D91F38D